MSKIARNMELLAPAQGPEQLALALHFGADAVYLAARRWGMRAGARNFGSTELAAAVERAHEVGARVHLTLNTVMTDADTDELPAFLKCIDELGVDAVIVADLGAMSLVREHAPHVEIHVSTQASVMSALTAEQYARLGAKRIVLAREMSLDQIAELRRRMDPDVELEVFAHGSLCMAYSGRCLLSAELMGVSRSPSWGACAQPCRWDWQREGDATVGLDGDGTAAASAETRAQPCRWGQKRESVSAADLVGSSAAAASAETRAQSCGRGQKKESVSAADLVGSSAAAASAETRAQSCGRGRQKESAAADQARHDAVAASAQTRTQPCRWDQQEENTAADLAGHDVAATLVEARSGAQLPVEVDERGSYLLSSHDLCLIEHLDELRAAGVNSLKLEGRAKGSYYTACVTNAYRQVLDGDDPQVWRRELDAVSHRPYSTGFLFGEPGQGSDVAGYVRERKLVALVQDCESCADGWQVELVCRNRALRGCELEILSPGSRVRSLPLSSVELQTDAGWQPAEGLVRNGARYRLQTPWPLNPYDLLCVRD